MKIKNLKRKSIAISLILILCGALVSAAGYGMLDFSYEKLMNSTVEDAWYHTIHIKNDSLWYGVKINDNIHIMSIGNAE